MEETIKELTDFDALICDSRLQMMKALIPFIPAREQKFLSVYVKYIELTKTMELVKNISSDKSVGICSLTGNSEKKELTDILQIIRKFSSNKDRETIDMIMNMMSIYRTFRMYKETMQSASDDPMSELLKNLLTPEQQEMFESYSSIMTP